MKDRETQPRELARQLLSLCKSGTPAEMDRAIDDCIPQLLEQCAPCNDLSMSESAKSAGLSRLAIAAERAEARAAAGRKQPVRRGFSWNWRWSAFGFIAACTAAVVVYVAARPVPSLEDKPFAALPGRAQPNGLLEEPPTPPNRTKAQEESRPPRARRDRSGAPIPAPSSAIPTAPHRALVAGWFKSVAGHPRVTSPGTLTVFGEKGVPIVAGSRIETGDADKAVIRFADGTAIHMAFNSQILVPADWPGSTKSVRPDNITLEKGKVYASVVRLPGHPRFQIKTRAATAVVLGTKFQIELRPGEGGQPAEARLRVSEGRVVFKNKFGERTATDGMETWAYEDGQPAEPRRFALLRTIRVNGDYMWPVETTRLTESAAVNKVVSRTSLMGDRRATLAMLSSPDARDNAAAQNDLGVLYELLDKMGPSVRAYGRATALAPNVARYRWNLGTALRNIGNYERAIEELSHAIRLDPSWLAPRESLGMALSESDRYDEAHMVLDEALRSFPNSGGLWRIKAKNQLLKGRFIDGIELAKKSAAMEPENPEAWKTLGLAYQVFKAFPEAEAAFRKAATLNPTDSGPAAGLATVLASQGQADEALQWFEAAMSLEPHNSEKFTAYARFLEAQGRPKEYVRIYRQAIAALPDHPQAYNNLAYRAARRYAPGVDLNEALRLANKAVELSNDDANVLHTRAMVFYRQGKFDSAEAELQRCVEAYGYDQAPGYVWGNFVEVAEARGDFSRTIARLEDAIARNPSNMGARSALSYALSKTGRSAEAFAQLERLLAEEPTSGALSTLYWNYMGSRPREVWSYLWRGYAILPKDALINSLLGEAFARQGDFGQAEMHFRQVVNADAGGYDAVQAYAHLAQYAYQRGDYSTSLSYVTRSVALSTGQIWRLLDLAANLRQHEPNGVIEALLSISSESKPDAVLLLGIGDLHTRAGETRLALERYEQVLQMDDLPWWVAIHALEQINAVDTKLALEHARRYAAIRSSDPRSLACLGGILRRLSSYSEAVRPLESALVGTAWGKTREAAFAWAELGVSYQELGRLPEALKAYRTALHKLDSDPSADWIRQNVRRITREDPEVQALLKRAEAKQGASKAEQAASWRQLERLYENRGNNHDRMGNTALARDNYLLATNALQRSIALAGGSRNDWIRLGRRQYILEDKAAAANAFRKALAIDPNDTDSLNWLTDILLSRGEGTQEALQLALKSIRLDPSNLNSRANAGWAYYLVGDFVNSEKYLDQSLSPAQRAREVALAEMWTILGIVKEELGKQTEAHEAYKISVRLNAANPSIDTALKRPRTNGSIHAAIVAAYLDGLPFDDRYFSLLGLLFSNHCNEEIVSLSTENLKRNPKDAGAMDVLAGRLAFMRPSEGVKVARQMLQLYPNSSRASLHLGASLVTLGNVEEAEKHLGRALVLADPADRMTVRDIWFYYGQLYDQKELFLKASEAYGKALENVENSPWVWARLSISLAKCGRYTQALNSVERQLADPTQAWVVVDVVEALLSANRPVEARTVCDRLRQIYDGLVAKQKVVPDTVVYSLCQSLYRLGDREAAEKLRRDVQIRFASDPLLWNVVCWLLAEWERYDEAVPMCLDGMERFPNDPNHPMNLAWCYFRLDKLSSAEELFESVLCGTPFGKERNAGQAMGWAALGQIYERTGRPADARNAYLQAIGLDQNNADARAGLRRIGS